MNTLYLLGSIGLLIGFFVNRKNNGGDKIFGVFIGSIVGLVVAFIVGAFGAGFLPTTDVVLGPAQLVAMRSSDGSSGTFIWGSGTIRQSTSYNFMIKLDDGSMTPGSVPANSIVRIIEDESLKGTGTWRTTIRKTDPASAFYSWTLFHSDNERTVRQEFRVPVGTVVQTFKVE